MPTRKTPLIKDEIYHVFNRSVAKQPIFRNKREQTIFIKLIEYYHFIRPPFRFSHYLRLDAEERSNLLINLYQQNQTSVDIYAFTLMPNHYHLLVKQTADFGIMNFIRLCQNSYAKYLNIKTNRSGSLFQSPFKAVRIETDDQLIHVARYIHLNPLTSYIIRDFNTLPIYEPNSYFDYLSETPRKFLNTSFLMTLFNNKKQKLEEFTRNNLDYQRHLDQIKHLTLE